MMISNWYRFISIVWLAVACSQSETLSETDRAEIILAAKETLNNYYNDIRMKGLTAEFRYLDNSKEFFWVPPGYPSPISYDSVVAILNQIAPLYKTVDNSFDTLSIIPLKRDLASYSGRLRSVMIDTAEQVTTSTMMETGILIKRKDGWKLLSGQTSMVITSQ
jgi:hypothetical protein